MADRRSEEKKGFWQRYKFYILGCLGAFLLIASMSVQNVVVYYKTADGTYYAVKLDYSAFGLCLRCNPMTSNANDVVEKAVFFCTGRETSVMNAAAALQEIAGTEEGEMQLYVGGLLGNNAKTRDKLIETLNGAGYDAKALESEETG